MHRFARWIGGLSHQISNLSHLQNLVWEVVIHALLNTGFKGIQVVNYPTNSQTTKVMLTKVFPKCLGACTWIHKVHSSSRMYFCSMRGTDIARVEGQWLNKGPNCSVPETQMTAPRLELTFLICFPLQIAWEITVTSFYDVIIICSTLSVGKPLLMCRGNAIICLHIFQHHYQNTQLLPLHPNHNIFSSTQILCLWHSPPGIIVCHHTEAWNLFTIFKDGYKTQACINNKLNKE